MRLKTTNRNTGRENRQRLLRLTAAAVGLFSIVAFASAQDMKPADPSTDAKSESPLARSMGITQKLGAEVPKDAEFLDETGKKVHFGDLLQGRPVVLVPIFYRCQTGCALVTDGVLKTLAKANKAENEMIVGRDLDVVMVSIHPKETPELARNKKALILNAIEPPNADSSWRVYATKGWHLLTGNLENIHKVTDAIGFKYKYDAEKDLINHPTCTVMLTKDGRISSYTIGNDFPTTLVKSDLALAAKNEIGVRADQSMMFGCVMLDPVTGRYRIVIERVMGIAAFFTILIVGGWIYKMILDEKNNRRPAPTAQV